MTERGALVLLAGAVLGALHPRPVPVLAAAGVAVGALALRRPLLVVAATTVLVSALGHRAITGLTPPEQTDVAATITLLTDPRPVLGGLRVEARLGDRRLDVRARGATAADLAPRLAGERLRVRGALGPLPRPTAWSESRHLAGRLRLHAVEGWAAGDPLSRAANGLRRTLETGAAGLGPGPRSLFTGLVVGDDRAQPAAMADDFRGAGLTHLLAVSGQNVAFILAVAAPVLRRLRLWPRLLVALGLVGAFAVVTRFEPSVLRASAMVGLALTATTLGRPLSRLRVLALAGAGLLVVDPLLVRSVGFQLSAGATAGIVVLAGRLEGALPGPPWLRAPLAVTVAAQLGVAPVLLAAFGPIPVASLPANLLAVPAAGLVMAWGLTGGLAAGAAVAVLPDGLGAAVALALHVPTRLLLAWVAEVAARAAALPLGHLGGPHLVALGAASGVLVRPAGAAALPERAPRRRLAALVVAVATLAAAVAAAQRPPGLRQHLAPGLVRWHAHDAEVLVLGGAGGRVVLRPAEALAALREAGVGAVDLVVVADGHLPHSLLEAVRARHPVGAVVRHGGPWPGSDVEAPLVVPAPATATVVRIGSLDLHLAPAGDRTVVEARRPP